MLVLIIHSHMLQKRLSLQFLELVDAMSKHSVLLVFRNVLLLPLIKPCLHPILDLNLVHLKKKSWGFKDTIRGSVSVCVCVGCDVWLVCIFHSITSVHEKELRGGTMLTNDRKKHKKKATNTGTILNSKATCADS